MSGLIVREFLGNRIRQREDGFLSLTDMAQANGKNFGDWSRLKGSQEYLEALQVERYADLHNGPVEIIQGGEPSLQGTWGDRQVALRFAQWISPQFALQVDRWIEELMLKGAVSIAEPLSVLDMIIASAQSQKILESRQEATEALLQQTIQEKNEQIRLLQQTVEAVSMESEANCAELERFRNGHGYCFSIAGWCSKQGKKLSTQELNILGRKATAMCRAKGIQPVPITDPRWGKVNTYPDSVLMEL